MKQPLVLPQDRSGERRSTQHVRIRNHRIGNLFDDSYQ